MTYTLLGSAAHGAIEPRAHQQSRLDEFTRRVSAGEFHVTLADITIPARCVDGRIPAQVQPLAPNAAGGSETLFVADDLTLQRFGGTATPTLAGYTAVMDAIMAAGQPVGGHTDTHAHDAKSGCGANDRLTEIYRYIAEHGAVLQEIASGLGVTVPHATHDRIVRNASARTQFSPGAALLDVLRQRAQSGFLDVLEGEHNEVLVVINKRAGTTLDRTTLAAAFGADYQAFNADVWSFAAAAALLARNDQETAELVAAMVYYNLATTLVLAGPGLRVVVLD